MIEIRSKKDKAEKEEEEVERNVRESPKKKPPRRDKERRTVEDEDKDIDKDPDTSEDKDLSMNYKDIGGSVVQRYLQKKAEEGGDEEKSTPPPPGSDKEDKSEDDEPSDSDENGDPLNKLDEILELEVEEEARGVIDRVVDHALKGTESDLSKPPEELAKDWYSKSTEELTSVLLSDNAEEKEEVAAKKALVMKKKPFPPGWDIEEVFEGGVLTLQARKKFRDHMKSWSKDDFERNLKKIKEHSLTESITDGSDLKEDYHSAIVDLVEDAKENQISGKYDPLKDLEEIVPEKIEKLSDIELSEKHQELLKQQAKVWRARVRKTKKEDVESLLDEVREKLDELDNQLSVEYAWYSVLWDILKGAFVMRKVSKREVARRVAKKAEYRGLPGPVQDPLEKPSQPEWRRPVDLTLTVDDYLNLLRMAGRWFESYTLEDLVEYDPDMACRVALDYAIYNSREGLYNGLVDAPTYNDLVRVLREKYID